MKKSYNEIDYINLKHSQQNLLCVILSHHDKIKYISWKKRDFI